jgi:hypothetical protein
MIWKLKALGVGNSSRQGAKAPSLRGKMKTLTNDFHPQSPTFAAFAPLREIFRVFGCGAAPGAS